jgi:hypothetical protein
MDTSMVIAICGFAVVCGAVSMKIAAGKDRNPSLWAIVGLVFNIPGLLAAVFVPPHVETSAAEGQAAKSGAEDRAGKAQSSHGAEAAVA